MGKEVTEMQTVRHARLTLKDEELGALHQLKWRLGRERGRRVNLDELLHEGVELLLKYYTSQGLADGAEAAGGAR